jgi:hypothetical protein
MGNLWLDLEREPGKAIGNIGVLSPKFEQANDQVERLSIAAKKPLQRLVSGKLLGK